jgi:uncharacterized membrane protein
LGYLITNLAESPQPENHPIDTRKSRKQDSPSSLAPADRTLDVDTERKELWEHVHQRLAGHEKEIYGLVLASDGVALQADLVEETGLSKATVSTALGRMEAKDLVEKRRAGVRNVIILRTPTHKTV